MNATRNAANAVTTEYNGYTSTGHGMDQYDREDAEFALQLTEFDEVFNGMTSIEKYGHACIVMAYLAECA